MFRAPLPARGTAGNRGALAAGSRPRHHPARLPVQPRPTPANPAPPAAPFVWRGLASAIVTPSGILAPPRKVQMFPPKVTRARIGAGTVAGGVASPLASPRRSSRSPPPTSGPPRTSNARPQRAPPSAVAARHRHRSPNVTPPLGAPSNPPARPVLQHLPAHRAVWRGLPSRRRSSPPTSGARSSSARRSPRGPGSATTSRRRRPREPQHHPAGLPVRRGRSSSGPRRGPAPGWGTTCSPATDSRPRLSPRHRLRCTR